MLRAFLGPIIFWPTYSSQQRRQRRRRRRRRRRRLAYLQPTKELLGSKSKTAPSRLWQTLCRGRGVAGAGQGAASHNDYAALKNADFGLIFHANEGWEG